MQGYEVAALYALVALTVLLLRKRIPDLLAAPLLVRLGVGTIIGLGLSVPILMHGRNLVRDRFEPVVIVAFVAVLIGLVIWLRR